jgi:hypothetical protein
MTTELGPKPRPQKVFTLGPGTVQLHNKSVHVKFDHRANRNRNGAVNQSKRQAASQQEGRRRGLGRHRGLGRRRGRGRLRGVGRHRGASKLPFFAS